MVLLTVGGVQVPFIPFWETDGRTGAGSPAHIGGNASPAQIGDISLKTGIIIGGAEKTMRTSPLAPAPPGTLL
jgi:hypothetical protein